MVCKHTILPKSHSTKRLTYDISHLSHLSTASLAFDKAITRKNNLGMARRRLPGATALCGARLVLWPVRVRKLQVDVSLGLGRIRVKGRYRPPWSASESDRVQQKNHHCHNPHLFTLCVCGCWKRSLHMSIRCILIETLALITHQQFKLGNKENPLESPKIIPGPLP